MENGDEMRRGGAWNWHVGLGRELGYIFWAMIGVEASFGAYVGIWPLWIEKLGAPITIVGLVLGSGGLLRLLTLAPSAALAERIEPRKLIVGARLLTGLGLITAGLASHWTQLLPMIVGSAVGEIAFPLTQGHLARHAGEQRVRAFTLVFNVGPAVAFGISPLISGALIARYGMQAAFFFAAACSLFSLFFFARFAPLHGATGPTADEASPESKSTYPEALREPNVRTLLALQFATIFALALGISLLPSFLADQRNISPALVAILGGLGSIGSVLYGLLIARSGRLQAAPFIAIGIAVLFVVTNLAVSVSTTLLWVIVIAFLGRGGLWSAWGLFVAALNETVRSDRLRPRAFTLGEMIGGTAFFSAPILAGQLYAIRPDLPLLASVAASLTLLPVLALTQRRLRSRTATEASSPTLALPASALEERGP